MRYKTLAVSFVLTLLFTSFVHAVFNLPSRITVPARIDGGQLKTDVVEDGEETVPLTGTTGTAVLNFSDLVSGPDTGLGDSLGSGVIVTVWGQFLGATQGSSVIEYCDSASVCRAGYVYYWKNADGQLPSGPANLFESHGMQEIAFSIPDSAAGIGNIRVRVGADTTSLPFTVRTGRITHVKATGNDNNAGTFASPFLTVARADAGGIAQLGDTIYIHGVSTGGPTVDRAIYNNSGLRNGYANQFSYAPYPGFNATVYGADGFHAYNSDGFVTSKLSIFASNCNATGGGCFTNETAGIRASDYGRAIGNYITDQPSGCANAQTGALSVNSQFGAAGVKFYGNHIQDYACPETTRFHHTTYFTLRDVYGGQTQDQTVDTFEVGWNYLKANKAQNGLHVYDEDISTGSGNLCGDLSGDLKIHNNVVIDQAGAGIEYKINCGWSQDTFIYNNIVIRSGLIADTTCTFNCAFSGMGIHIGDGLNYGDITVSNNLVYTWDAGNVGGSWPQACFSWSGNAGGGSIIRANDNICYNSLDRPFTELNYNSENALTNVSGAGNLFYKAAGSNTPPTWATSSLSGNPLLTLTGSRISVGSGSPIINQSSTTQPRDIYGVIRGATSNVGPVNGSN